MPYTVQGLIREAIAKTFFLRKRERVDKFREEQTTGKDDYL